MTFHGVIVQESQRLGLLIANLLDYAQIEKGPRRYAQLRQDISELARHAAATFETLREQRGSRFKQRLADDSEPGLFQGAPGLDQIHDCIGNSQLD